jgi:myo-inositol-1-phosphate synthase
MKVREGPPMRSSKVRVALAGVGNCASAFVQGLGFYADASGNEPIPGLMRPVLGGYKIGDIAISAAFDISAAKVGRPLGVALAAPPNNTIRFSKLPYNGIKVLRGPTFDGLGQYLRDDIVESPEPQVDVARVLADTRTDVLVSYLPVGSQQATEWYAERALEAGCAFVNCIPVFIASRLKWRKRFEERGLPIIGDDVKSQVGATIVHRVLTNLFRERGVRLKHTYQLNFGGNADFKNMLDRSRLESKKKSKTEAVVSQIDLPMDPGHIHIGPSDYVPWLGDRKFAHIRMEGIGFGGLPLTLELKLEVWDSPNSAGVVIDAVRCAKIALDRGIGGALIGPSSHFMKSPPQQFSEDEARRRTEQFILGTDGSSDRAIA